MSPGAHDDVWELPFDYHQALAAGYEGSESDAYTDLGIRLERHCRLSDARTAFERATELDDLNSRAWYHYGRCLMSAGEVELAARALSRAAELCPDHWVTLQELGKALATLGRHGEAIQVFTRAHSENPRAASVLVARGTSLCAAGRLEDGIADLERAMDVEPAAKRTRKLIDEWREHLRGGNDPPASRDAGGSAV